MNNCLPPGCGISLSALDSHMLLPACTQTAAHGACTYALAAGWMAWQHSMQPPSGSAQGGLPLLG